MKSENPEFSPLDLIERTRSYGDAVRKVRRKLTHEMERSGDGFGGRVVGRNRHRAGGGVRERERWNGGIDGRIRHANDVRIKCVVARCCAEGVGADGWIIKFDRNLRIVRRRDSRDGQNIAFLVSLRSAGNFRNDGRRPRAAIHGSDHAAGRGRSAGWRCGGFAANEENNGEDRGEGLAD